MTKKQSKEKTKDQTQQNLPRRKERGRKKTKKPDTTESTTILRGPPLYVGEKLSNVEFVETMERQPEPPTSNITTDEQG
jgi:hypothetical protein